MKTLLTALLTILIAFSVQAQNSHTHGHPEHLETLVEEYLNMKNSLTSDDLESAQIHLQAFSDEVKNSDEMNDHEEHSVQHDMHHGAMATAVKQAENADDIQSFRLTFKEISEQLLTALENQGYEGDLFNNTARCMKVEAHGSATRKRLRIPFMDLKCTSVGKQWRRLNKCDRIYFDTQ